MISAKDCLKQLLDSTSGKDMNTKLILTTAKIQSHEPTSIRKSVLPANGF